MGSKKWSFGFIKKKMTRENSRKYFDISNYESKYSLSVCLFPSPSCPFFPDLWLPWYWIKRAEFFEAAWNRLNTDPNRVVSIYRHTISKQLEKMEVEKYQYLPMLCSYFCSNSRVPSGVFVTYIVIKIMALLAIMNYEKTRRFLFDKFTKGNKIFQK